MDQGSRQIRKEGHRAMNWDEGSYQLSHAFLMRQLIVWVPASSDEDLVMRSKRQNKVLKFWLWYMNFLLGMDTITIYQQMQQYNEN